MNLTRLPLEKATHLMQPDADMDCMDIDAETATPAWSQGQLDQTGMGTKLQNMNLQGRVHCVPEAMQPTGKKNSDIQTRVDSNYGRRRKKAKQEQANALHDRVSTCGTFSQRTPNDHTELATYQQPSMSASISSTPIPSYEEYVAQAQQNGTALRILISRELVR